MLLTKQNLSSLSLVLHTLYVFPLCRTHTGCNKHTLIACFSLIITRIAYTYAMRVIMKFKLALPELCNVLTAGYMKGVSYRLNFMIGLKWLYIMMQKNSKTRLSLAFGIKFNCKSEKNTSIIICVKLDPAFGT